MPQMDGYQATTEIREYERLVGKFTPIIALTANALDSERQKCFEVGMNGFLTKPLTLKKLNRSIKEIMAEFAALL